MPYGDCKDNSLRELLGKLDITEDELIACGDGMNDIPMLKIAGLSAVMGKHIRKLKSMQII